MIKEDFPPRPDDNLVAVLGSVIAAVVLVVIVYFWGGS